MGVVRPALLLGGAVPFDARGADLLLNAVSLRSFEQGLLSVRTQGLPMPRSPSATPSSTGSSTVASLSTSRPKGTSPRRPPTSAARFALFTVTVTEWRVARVRRRRQPRGALRGRVLPARCLEVSVRGMPPSANRELVGQALQVFLSCSPEPLMGCTRRVP